MTKKDSQKLKNKHIGIEYIHTLEIKINKNDRKGIQNTPLKHKQLSTISCDPYFRFFSSKPHYSCTEMEKTKTPKGTTSFCTPQHYSSGEIN